MHKRYLSLLIALFVVWSVVLYNDLFFVRSLVVDGSLHQIASVVGLSASVPKNEFNTLAQQLTEKEQELSERERSLKEQEALLLDELRKKQEEENKKTAIFVSLLGLLLLALILFNFYSDWKRRT